MIHKLSEDISFNDRVAPIEQQLSELYGAPLFIGGGDGNYILEKDRFEYIEPSPTRHATPEAALEWFKAEIENGHKFR